MNIKPVVAFRLSLIAGIVIFVLGFPLPLGDYLGVVGKSFWTITDIIVSFLGLRLFPFWSLPLCPETVSVAWGTLVIIGAIILYRMPNQHATGGAVVVVFSILSLLTPSLGGFCVGTALGVFGGISGILLKAKSTSETPASG